MFIFALWHHSLYCVCYMYVYIAGAMQWYAAILAHVMNKYCNLSYPAPRLSLHIRRLPQTLDIKHMVVKWNSSMRLKNMFL